MKANERVKDRPLWMVSSAIDIIWPGVARARFLPAIQRYMALARTHTTGYAGDFQTTLTSA